MWCCSRHTNTVPTIYPLITARIQFRRSLPPTSPGRTDCCANVDYGERRSFSWATVRNATFLFPNRLAPCPPHCYYRSAASSLEWKRLSIMTHVLLSLELL